MPISQLVIALSTEELETRSKKIGLPLAPTDLVISTVNSIRAKGGRCSLDVIRTAIGKSAGMVNWATSAATSLGLVRLEDDDYALTPLGDRFAAATESEMKQILKEVVLNYEPYHTILLRLKNSPNRTLAKNDVTKAWYDLYRSGTDSTRRTYTGSFASICSWCGIIENRKKTVVLTDEGADLLEATTPSQPPLPQITETAKTSQLGVGASKTGPDISIPLTATITINISVDTKEKDSVDNLIRVIKALREERASSLSE
jgi:hypothetical protein